MRQQEWAKLHGAVLLGLMSGDIETEIDSRGRLIVVDHSNTSVPWDVDNDRFHETIVLTAPLDHPLQSRFHSCDPLLKLSSLFRRQPFRLGRIDRQVVDGDGGVEQGPDAELVGGLGLVF